MTDKQQSTTLTLVPVADLHPNDYNPNEMSDGAFAEFVAEVRHLRRLPKPIVVRTDGDGYVIVDGEHAWRAAQEVGLTEALCEVIDADDFEAMRQSYKRNQHGEHNPVLLGRMFQRMMEERDLSQRALAKHIDVSEGTVRNMLEYARAAEVRNDYAFERLSVKQMRAYNRLPKEAGDLWLRCGADLGALKYGFYDDLADVLSYEQHEPYLPLLRDLCYVHNGNGFRQAAERMFAFSGACTLVDGTEPLPAAQALPYLKALARVRWRGKDPAFMGSVAKEVLSEVFRIVDGEIKPALPFDAFAVWLESPDNEWTSFKELQGGIRLLVGKHTDTATMMQKVREELMARELESAPEYIRDAVEVPVRQRYDLMALTADAPEDVIDKVKREAMQSLLSVAERDKMIEDYMDQGKFQIAMALATQSAQWTAKSAFEHRLSEWLREHDLAERNALFADRDRLTRAVVDRLKKHYTVREEQIRDCPAHVVLKERLDRLPWPELRLLAAYVLEYEMAAVGFWFYVARTEEEQEAQRNGQC